MTTIIQDSRSAFSAEGWRIGMSVNVFNLIHSPEEKLNLTKCLF
jgi:hypothetical protein